ncbi:hypothetical protein KZZ52_37485 [Dactylosporangium sp. AC04546]|uniref:tetratricopeptide repeat protein n=1 Tax=Dactylosporangium sp. AC04546 TaxID=2862460 RepID=UPI001EDE5C1D|nr:hypothetical protein [Dactylosporangium sp. AC04546]WVK79658.1 hypothetical protein KZZ52_37485 [Dactylosporangium sp. AC04546]
MALTAYERGLLAVQRRDLEAGRALLEEAGDHAAALLLLGQIGSDPACYERAAALGSATAAYNLGAVAANEERYTDALRWYARSAELGDTGALRMLGAMHATGQGTAADDAEAERLWLAAAGAGDTQALLDLGVLHLHHRDDPVTGTSWLLQAAKPVRRRLLAPRRLRRPGRPGPGAAVVPEDARRGQRRRHPRGPEDRPPDDGRRDPRGRPPGGQDPRRRGLHRPAPRHP